MNEGIVLGISILVLYVLFGYMVWNDINPLKGLFAKRTKGERK